ncbi:ABC transporter permease [Kribbella sp. ALI-6-A]|uniref:ABC transporter permease n=1 Tax=Kribbella sp. ALI-6-A TaxID=1933817 RepID=UPI00097C116B|nr:ABC transporter permease [Kribbella sp. ALI-6-A]ONI73585.1 ABC transporter permease [Kribbella sp. ALI-6-A]
MSTATITVDHRSTPGGLRGSMAAEWTKLWSVRSSWLNVIGAIALTGLLGLQLGFSAAYERENPGPGQVVEPATVGAMAIGALMIVQVVIAAFAMVPVTSEYATGSIRSTLQWTPVRRDVLLGKALVLAPVLFVYGALLGLVAAIGAGLAAGQWADWNASALVTDLAKIGAYSLLAGLFTAGIAFVIRNTAGTLTAAFLLLLVVPLMLGQSSIRALQWLAALLPGGAGEAFLSGSGDLMSPALSFAVLVAWAIGGLALGLRVLQRHDA